MSSSMECVGTPSAAQISPLAFSTAASSFSMLTFSGATPADFASALRVALIDALNSPSVWGFLLRVGFVCSVTSFCFLDVQA